MLKEFSDIEKLGIFIAGLSVIMMTLLVLFVQFRIGKKKNLAGLELLIYILNPFMLRRDKKVKPDLVDKTIIWLMIFLGFIFFIVGYMFKNR